MAGRRKGRAARTQQAFMFETVAVLVSPWSIGQRERGVRVEVRLLTRDPHRGSWGAAQRVVVDAPVFRADLFDRLDRRPGNLRSAHFHSHFEGFEPCEREWDDTIRRDPNGWLRQQLGDLVGLVERSGVTTPDAGVLERDAAELRDALPRVIAAVDATWTDIRACQPASERWRLLRAKTVARHLLRR